MLIRNTQNIEILTPSGFQPFYGINKTSKPTVELKFEDQNNNIFSIETTPDHPFPVVDDNNIEKVLEAQHITTERVKNKNLELCNIVKKTFNNNHSTVYDVINVANGNTFIANDLVVHNCQFLSSDALLLDPMFLAQLTKQQANITEKANIKDVRFWEEIQQNSTYLIGVDPATGNGADFSVITVFSFPQLTQVAQYRSNTTSTNDLYNILKNILFQFERKKCSVYFSIENNGVGEGIISLYEQDENSPDCAEFISEGNKRGMTTTSKTKMKACINFREMLQRNQLTIKSPILLTELKSYVRKKGAYAAMTGATDDCVSACLIVVRLVEEISTYEQEAFDKLYSGNFDDWSGEAEHKKDIFAWDDVDNPNMSDEDYDPLPFV